MRIAQVSPLWERVPPPAYGGVELVVSRLTDELVRRGHEVVLFASGDSQTLAELRSVYPRAIRLDPAVQDYKIYEMLELSQVYEQADQFDIIHSHVGYGALPFSNLVKTPTVHTLHNPFTPDNCHLFAHHKHQPHVSLSDAQREPYKGLNYVRTVYNGIDPKDYPFYANPQEPPYLAFLGRISPEKGTHHAITIAKQTGWHLKIAGKVDVVDREYFEREIEPQIDGKQIEYLGEANHAQKVELLGNAVAMLFPITWREPFGLVMIESMCVGTPVIAMSLGAVPEVIAHGRTGFVCYNLEEMIAAIPSTLKLSRMACREHVVNRFSVTHMVDGYEAVYRQLVQEKITQTNGHLHSSSLLKQLSPR